MFQFQQIPIIVMKDFWKKEHFKVSCVGFHLKHLSSLILKIHPLAHHTSGFSAGLITLSNILHNIIIHIFN
jgi:hypothetical protein